jgi:hypothetical protein
MCSIAAAALVTRATTSDGRRATMDRLQARAARNP